MYYVSMPVCMAERTGVFGSISRSIFLTEGHRWQIFGVILLFAFIDSAIYMIVIVQLVLPQADQIETLIKTEAAWAVITAVDGVVASVFYYELRGVKEGSDIDKIASVFE